MLSLNNATNQLNEIKFGKNTIVNIGEEAPYSFYYPINKEQKCLNTSFSISNSDNFIVNYYIIDKESVNKYIITKEIKEQSHLVEIANNQYNILLDQKTIDDNLNKFVIVLIDQKNIANDNSKIIIDIEHKYKSTN